MRATLKQGEEPAASGKIGLPVGLAEDYIHLSNNILALHAGNGIKNIAVSSSAHGEGVTTVAANLAIALARKETSNILLIDGNLRKPSVPQFFGVDRGEGLAECISGDRDLAAMLRKTALPNLQLLTSGNSEKEPSQFFTHARFQTFLNELGSRFDLILFDTPPISLYPETVLLSAMVDGVLLVIQAERLIYEVIRKAKDKVLSHGGTLVGTVLNRRRYYIPNAIYKNL